MVISSANSYVVLVVNAPYQPLKNIWIEIALCDSGAFHVTLGNAAHALNQITNNSIVKGPEALSHYETSTRTLRHRLNSPTESTSEGAIANILGHVCLAVCAIMMTGSSRITFLL